MSKQEEYYRLGNEIDDMCREQNELIAQRQALETKIADLRARQRTVSRAREACVVKCSMCGRREFRPDSGELPPGWIEVQMPYEDYEDDPPALRLETKHACPADSALLEEDLADARERLGL
jgi:hypothetical protein